MSWTYSGNPETSTLDEVRFLLGDTKETPQSLTDTEITYLLSQNNDVARAAAADAAEIMASRYAELSVTSKKVGNLSLSFSYTEVGGRYSAMAVRLRNRTSLSGLFASRDDRRSQFSVGMNDYAGEDRGRVYRIGENIDGA